MSQRNGVIFDIVKIQTNIFRYIGDKTVRLWDLQTELPEKTLEGHLHWVLCEYRNYKNMHLNNAVHAGISWSPNGKKLASACKLGKVFELYIKILNSIHKIFYCTI